jgi:hypothetical protein
MLRRRSGDGELRLNNEPASAVIRSCSVRPCQRMPRWPVAEPTLYAGHVTETAQVTLILDPWRAPGPAVQVHARSIAGIRQPSQKSAETGPAGTDRS